MSPKEKGMVSNLIAVRFRQPVVATSVTMAMFLSIVFAHGDTRIAICVVAALVGFLEIGIEFREAIESREARGSNAVAV
jgi:hypothetical protein